ncbi:MAG TPA: family 10 glycosylhydrolase [Phycisphaerae bacterium]|nr:family 10 glycosylhydrolase [Phycisphaerae bacterium]
MRSYVVCLLACALGLVLWFGGCTWRGWQRKQDVKVGRDKLPKAAFEWKALWVWISPDSSRDDVQRMVSLAADTGFNVIIVNTAGGGVATYNSRILKTPEGRQIEPFAEVIREARGRKLEVYAWIGYLANSGADTFQKQHPDWVQVVTPAEQAKAKARTRTNPDRVDVHGGSWLCPDRGLSDYERSITQEVVRTYDVDGIAIDFLGYRNYRACFCEHSTAQRRRFAEAHPELSAEQVLREHSEQSLARFSKQVREAADAVRSGVKVAVHVYPDFDPNPQYGNRLWADYCGQTIAWFYKPFWPYEKVRDKHLGYMAVQGQYHALNRHVPFVGCRWGNLLKPAERIRTEIRIAGLGGCKRIMFAFYETLAKHPEVAQVLKEELN